MRASRHLLMLAVLVMGGLLLWGVPDAQALSYSGGGSGSGGATTAADCSDYVGVTNRIAGCVRATIGNVTTAFFNPTTGFYTILKRAISAFLVLGVSIYGVMVAAGMIEKLGRDTLMLLLKVALITYFTQNTPLMYNYVTSLMDAAAQVVVQATPATGTAEAGKDFADLKCLQNMTQASEEAGAPVVGPWLAMDCLIDTIIGIKIDSNTVSTGLSAGAGERYFNQAVTGRGMSRGLIYFFFSGVQTSVVGLILGVIGFIFIWGMITIIIKALMTYIAGYIGIAFMIIISPLMIPLVLFQRTKEYFDKWVKLLISFSMQPVLMLLFISLTITAVDLALVSGDYSVMYRIAGDASRQSSFNINSYLTEKGAISKEAKLLFFSKTTTNTPKDENISQANSIISNLSTSSDCLEEVASTQSGEGKKCAGNTATQMFRDSINWKKLAEARSPAVVPEADAKPEQQIAREVLAAAIFLGVVVFVMNRLMAVVPHVILDLVGDFGQTPSMNRVATEQWNNAANQASGGLSSSIGQSLKSLTDRRGGAE